MAMSGMVAPVAMEPNRLQGLLRMIIVIRPIRLVLVFTG